MAVFIPVCGITVFFVQKFYLKTSRQLRLLDLEAKSPLYSNFIETLEGLVTIRAFGWQTQFERHNQRLLIASQGPRYLLFCVQRWLSLVLDMLVAVLAVVLIVLATQLKSRTSMGAIGVALVNVTNFNQSLTNLVRSWTAMETSLGAIARIKGFVSGTPSEQRSDMSEQHHPGWPRAGIITFDRITAAYRYLTVCFTYIAQMLI